MSSHRLPSNPRHPSFSEDFGLIAWLEQTRVHLPLRGVETRFHIVGSLARVEINTVFENSCSSPLDVSYLFPLPSGASVYRCELIADGRTIAAVVEHEHVARDLFNAAKREGRRAALVTTRRDNLFSLNLGNIQAGEIVAVRLAYVQELERAVHTVSLRIPVCPGPRYIPGKPLLRSNRGSGTVDDTDEVPDASLISPPHIDALHPDAALFHLCGHFPPGIAQPEQLVSPSHAIAIRSTHAGLVVGFASDEQVPDADFILRWHVTELAPGTAQLTSGSVGEKRYGLLRVMPPAPPVAVDLTPRQLWFLIDRSGSMAGEKWTKTCQALLDCVARLPAHDRVFVTLFADQSQHFAEKPLPPAELLEDPRFRSIAALGVGGGTEILPALKALLHVFAAHHNPSAAAHLVLITDGQVANEDAVHQALSSHPDLRIHTLGIDTAVNDGLLKKLAEDHGGRCVFISPSESVTEAVEVVLRGSCAAAISDLRLAPGVTSPQRLPVRLIGRLEFTLPVQGAWQDHTPLLEATKPDGTTWVCTPEAFTGDGDVLRLISARKEITRLETEGKFDDALALARTTNLLCKGASFLAIDLQSRVAVATEEFEQPIIREFSEPRGACASSGFSESLALPDLPAWKPTIAECGHWRGSGELECVFLSARFQGAMITDGFPPRILGPDAVQALLRPWLEDLHRAVEAMHRVNRIIANQRLFYVPSDIYKRALHAGSTPVTWSHPDIQREWAHVDREWASQQPIIDLLGFHARATRQIFDAYRDFILQQTLTPPPR